MRTLFNEIRVSITATLVLSIIVCGFYPLAVWGIGGLFFPHQAEGALITVKGKVVGSELIGQNFEGPKYFHSRPSLAGEVGYDATSSGGSNLGPTSGKLIEAVKERVEKYRTENNLPPGTLVPADAVTASASGLDPHISKKNALFQATRVANERGLTERTLLEKIEEATEGRDFGIFGEPGVNVLKLNLSLDVR